MWSCQSFPMIIYSTAICFVSPLRHITFMDIGGAKGNDMGEQKQQLPRSAPGLLPPLSGDSAQAVSPGRRSKLMKSRGSGHLQTMLLCLHCQLGLSCKSADDRGWFVAGNRPRCLTPRAYSDTPQCVNRPQWCVDKSSWRPLTAAPPGTPSFHPLPELCLAVVKCVYELSSKRRKSGYELKSAVFAFFPPSFLAPPPLSPHVLRGSGPGDPPHRGRRKPPDEFDYVGAS